MVQNGCSYSPIAVPQGRPSPQQEELFELGDSSCSRLFTPARMMSLKQDRGHARYLVLGVRYVAGAWLFPLVRMQLRAWEEAPNGSQFSIFVF